MKKQTVKIEIDPTITEEEICQVSIHAVQATKIGQTKTAESIIVFSKKQPNRQVRQYLSEKGLLNKTGEIHKDVKKIVIKKVKTIGTGIAHQQEQAFSTIDETKRIELV